MLVKGERINSSSFENVWLVAQIGLNEWCVDSVYLLVNGYGLTCGRDLDGGFDLVSS